MTDVVRYLGSLAQALAKMSLYAEDHPARRRASDTSFEELQSLQAADPRPTFSFIGRQVVYNQHAVADLSDWDWAARLSEAGVQRIEFEADVTGEEYRAFLDGVLGRIAQAGRAGEASGRAEAWLEPGVRFGAVGVRAVTAASPGRSDEEGAGGARAAILDVTEEADTVSWMHGEVGAAHRLPLLEAEAVVSSLTLAMHTDQQVFLPLLTLKEFDQYTTTHALNVAVLSMALAEHLGLSGREVRAYGVAGLLHDLGKVQVPPEVLRKPGRLTPEERALIEEHPVNGARLILQSDNQLDLSAAVAFEHHVMIDGGGYPTRRTRRDCHHASRLVHVCDVFDALRTNRPYRVAWETDRILQYIAERARHEFDLEIARAFLGMMTAWELRMARARSIDGDGEAQAA
jgi:putative nucleotidyltransferase with HDIG domain